LFLESATAGIALQDQLSGAAKMIEAAKITIGLFCGGLLAALAVEAHLRTGGSLVRVRSVSSMYRREKWNRAEWIWWRGMQVR